MIETIGGLPDNIVALEAKGEVTAEDYETVLIPAVEAASAAAGKARMLFVLGDDFESYQADAALDDAKMGMHHWNDFERIAVVTDHTVYRALIKGFGFLMPGEVKVYSVSEMERARRWIAG